MTDPLYAAFAPQDFRRNLAYLAVVIAVLVTVAYFFDIEAIRAQIEHAGVYAPLLLIAAKAATIIIAPLGGSPLYPLAGALFGFWESVLYLMIGDMIGGIVTFYLSRLFGRRLALRLLQSDESVLSRALELMSTMRGFLIARLTFLTFPELSSYGAGLTKIRFLPFLLIYSGVGILPVMLTAGIGSIIVGDSWGYAIPAVLLSGMVLSGISFLIFARMLSQHERDARRNAQGGDGGGS